VTTAPVPQSSPELRPEGSALRVLVVDDNQDAASMLGEAVTMLGCDARVAHDGPAAILVADEFAPHVALLDIGLPVMDGYELATRLRDSRRGEQLRLVAITGYGQSADRERAASVGFDAHLVKPVDLDRIARLLDGWRGKDGRAASITE
jgi:CheY-like chemotaxis protein